jgi:putative alpha-1,2-mannosidase
LALPERPWFRHAELAQGGVLRIVLDSAPNVGWGGRPQDAPPSMSGQDG